MGEVVKFENKKYKDFKGQEIEYGDLLKRVVPLTEVKPYDMREPIFMLMQDKKSKKDYIYVSGSDDILPIEEAQTEEDKRNHTLSRLTIVIEKEFYLEILEMGKNFECEEE